MGLVFFAFGVEKKRNVNEKIKRKSKNLGAFEKIIEKNKVLSVTGELFVGCPQELFVMGLNRRCMANPS